MQTNVEMVLEKWGDYMIQLAQKRLGVGGPPHGTKNFTGTLSNSLGWKYARSANGFTLQFYGAKYLINVERGRRAGAHKGSYIPIKPLIAWIKKKNIPLNPNRKKVKPTVALNKRQNIKFDKEQAIRGFAFAISRSVKNDGFKTAIQPFPVFDVARKISSHPKFKKEMNDAIVADMKTSLNYTIKSMRV